MVSNGSSLLPKELLNNRGLIADVVQRSVLRRGAAAAFMRLGELKAARAELELAELELAYAPPYGSAKDPVNLAGMAAQNVRGELVSLAQWHEVAALDPATTVLLDVRNPEEWAYGEILDSVDRFEASPEKLNF